MFYAEVCIKHSNTLQVPGDTRGVSGNCRETDRIEILQHFWTLTYSIFYGNFRDLLRGFNLRSDGFGLSALKFQSSR